ncbi:MAG: hypothetical protein HUJ69_00960 [Lachnospiraceae bacterium]|nr:hypothetical protein [Lachnospiraceae bacterium]
MLTPNNLIEQYLPFIRSLCNTDAYSQSTAKDTLLNRETLLFSCSRYTMFYAPHNDYMEPNASIAIIGITPGWTQTQTAYETVIQLLSDNPSVSTDELTKEAKYKSRFAGSMRSNLIKMLDDLCLPDYLSIPDAGTLFRQDCRLLHTTSILKYPVFTGNSENYTNYSGSSPSILSDPYLKDFSANSLEKELAVMRDLKLIIPLGKAAETTILELMPEYSHILLRGLPHPSGLNAHRAAIFSQNKTSLESQIRHILGR